MSIHQLALNVHRNERVKTNENDDDNQEANIEVDNDVNDQENDDDRGNAFNFTRMNNELPNPNIEKFCKLFIDALTLLWEKYNKHTKLSTASQLLCKKNKPNMINTLL